MLLRGLAALVVLGCAVPAPAFADPENLVDHTEWVRYGGLSNDGLPSLRVYPTQLGRTMAGRVGTVAEGERAWAEVLASAPDADTPGMHDQFLCHWQFAEFARPGKTSWNLEPWRPVVDPVTMVDSDCNPGAPEEGF